MGRRRAYGIDARTATEWSLWLQGLYVLCVSVLLVLHIFTKAFGSLVLLQSPLFPWIYIVVLVDGVARMTHLIGDSMAPPGFLEWLIPARLRSFRFGDEK